MPLLQKILAYCRTNPKLKIIGIVILSLIILFQLKESIATSILDQKYWGYNINNDELIVFNPFNMNYPEFSSNNLKLEENMLKEENDSIVFYSKKILEFRNSYNEKRYEDFFSCSNDYWDYKNKSLILYSKASLNTNHIDSAISVLKPGLILKDGYRSYKIDKQFFTLQMIKYSRKEIINKLKKEWSLKKNIECYSCSDHVFSFDGTNIGYSSEGDLPEEKNLISILKLS